MSSRRQQCSCERWRRWPRRRCLSRRWEHHWYWQRWGRDLRSIGVPSSVVNFGSPDTLFVLKLRARFMSLRAWRWKEQRRSFRNSTNSQTNLTIIRYKSRNVFDLSAEDVWHIYWNQWTSQVLSDNWLTRTVDAVGTNAPTDVMRVPTVENTRNINDIYVVQRLSYKMIS